MTDNVAKFTNLIKAPQTERQMYLVLKRIVENLELIYATETTNASKYANHTHEVSGVTLTSLPISGGYAAALSGQSSAFSTTTLTIASV